MSRLPPDPKATAWAVALSRIGVASAMAISGSALVGWTLHVPVLRTWLNGAVSMNPMTALCLFLCAAALLLRSRRPFVLPVAGAVTTVGALRLLAYVAGTDTVVDRILFREQLALDPIPNRMAPNTAWCFVLTGAAILLLAWDEPRARRGSRALATVSLVSAGIPLLGYLYGVSGLYGIAWFIPMALPTALAFTVLSHAILAVRTDEGVFRILTGAGSGGTAARRLVLVALTIPPALGWLRGLAQRTGMASAEVGLAVMVVATMIIVAGIAIRTSLVLETMDEEKQALNAELERRVELRTAELARLNLDLERRIQERTAKLAAANEELESFSYSVSHDLRAPLRHATGFLEVLERHLGEGVDETARRYMGKVRHASEQMARLIDDLLEFSRMGRAPLQEKEVALSDVLAQVRREIEPEVAGRKIVWKIGTLPAVRGDAAMVRQVLANLVSNAVKYTRPREQARIEITGEAANGEVVVHVRDNGVGFDERYAPKLFGVFQRLHRDDEFEGTGIGLANVRRVVHRHGGRVWAEGELDKGATFSFTLPRA